MNIEDLIKILNSLHEERAKMVALQQRRKLSIQVIRTELHADQKQIDNLDSRILSLGQVFGDMSNDEGREYG